MNHKHFRQMSGEEIERTSMAIITSELDRELDPAEAPVIKRVIHTTADFEYAQTLRFSAGVIDKALSVLKTGCTIVTDTNMARSGINAAAARQLGCDVRCFMADEDVKEKAKRDGTTRALASMDKAAGLEGPLIFAIGNAPTALIRIVQLSGKGLLKPELVIGVPVGFVNVVEAKELLLDSGLPCIVNRGRKGGSGVAAAIVNALMYRLTRGSR